MERGWSFQVYEDAVAQVYDESPIPFSMLFGWAVETANHLRCLKGAKLVHRDIKQSQWVLSRETNRLMLIDYGLSCYAYKKDCLDANDGTKGYKPPEVKNKHGSKGKYKIDIFSLGVAWIVSGIAQPLKAMAKTFKTMPDLHGVISKMDSDAVNDRPDVEKVMAALGSFFALLCNRALNQAKTIADKIAEPNDKNTLLNQIAELKLAVDKRRAEIELGTMSNQFLDALLHGVSFYGPKLSVGRGASTTFFSSAKAPLPSRVGVI
jgi:serine/threonine protein kinase